jgi:alkanesulfonate monooxygenase SsuD/methylene tetrahydromethanopterin reductase-like flavin-dependent oxidoreductase (luciferase family)
MWAATGDPTTAAEVGRRGMVNVLVLRGADGTRKAWASYRKARAEAGLPKVTTDNFAYAALVYVGDTDAEGLRVGEKLLWFLNTSLKSAPQFTKFLPGTVPAHATPMAWRTKPRSDGGGPASPEKGVASASANAASLIGITPERAIQQGILFCGNPDTVYRQIKEFYDQVGGFGHLTMIGRSGPMTHAESEAGIKRLAKEVMPRLQAIKPVMVE